MRDSWLLRTQHWPFNQNNGIVQITCSRAVVPFTKQSTALIGKAGRNDIDQTRTTLWYKSVVKFEFVSAPLQSPSPIYSKVTITNNTPHHYATNTHVLYTGVGWSDDYSPAGMATGYLWTGPYRGACLVNEIVGTHPDPSSRGRGR